MAQKNKPTAGKVEQVQAGELSPWEVAELPKPPPLNFGTILKAIGPGAILLSISIGSGEWLLGPATVAKYGAALLWITTVSVILQVLLNMEFVRYTMYTGEPILTGFMRTRPGPTFWGWFYTICAWLQMGWPGWALASATAVTALQLGRLPGTADKGTVLFWGYATFLLCVAILAVGERVEKTLERVSWFLVIWIIVYLLLIDLFMVSPSNWGGLVKGYFSFGTIPSGADWVLLGAFAAYSGAGGLINSTVSNWCRDKGFGMGSVIGYIPAVVGGKAIKLSATGRVFKPTPENMNKWKGWWKLAGFDQYWLWAGGAFFGMGLPALLVMEFVQPGAELGGWGTAAHIAGALSQTGGRALWFLTLLVGFWILFGTQLGIMDGFVRLATDNLWAGSPKVREWVGGDVRKIYYTFLILFALSGAVAINLATPLMLIKIGANMAGLNFVFLAIHTLVINRKFLPKELQPPMWRQIMLVLTALFFLFFVTMLILNQVFGMKF